MTRIARSGFNLPARTYKLPLTRWWILYKDHISQIISATLFLWFLVSKWSRSKSFFQSEGPKFHEAGNHACQLRVRQRSMQFPCNQTANTGALYVAAPSQRILVIPYANSMLLARAYRASRSNQYYIRKIGCRVQLNNLYSYNRQPGYHHNHNHNN